MRCIHPFSGFVLVLRTRPNDWNLLYPRACAIVHVNTKLNSATIRLAHGKAFWSFLRPCSSHLAWQILPYSRNSHRRYHFISFRSSLTQHAIHIRKRLKNNFVMNKGKNKIATRVIHSPFLAHTHLHNKRIKKYKLLQEVECGT